MATDTQKLRVLRARTDHELLILIQRELDRGFALAEVANSKCSPLFVQAEKAAATVKTLLGRIAGVSPQELERIDSKLKELRLRIDCVPSPLASPRSYPASYAS